MSLPAALPAAPSTRLARLRALVPAFALVLVFRLACYAAMTALALWNEYRAAPSLTDTLVSQLPYVAWIDRLNYLAWLLLYLPLATLLLAFEPERWLRYMVTGGLVSLARGVCIAATALGPPDPAHAGPGVQGRPFFETWVDLVSPIGVFAHGSARAYLTKDLFFSGHTATTFLLLLYVWRLKPLRIPAILAHVIVVSTVFFAHLHYTIDVLGAYAATFALYALREWRPKAG